MIEIEVFGNQVKFFERDEKSKKIKIIINCASNEEAKDIQKIIYLMNEEYASKIYELFIGKKLELVKLSINQHIIPGNEKHNEIKKQEAIKRIANSIYNLIEFETFEKQWQEKICNYLVGEIWIAKFKDEIS